MTRNLEVGDIVMRNTDGDLWVLIGSTKYPKDICTMHFFSLKQESVQNYTSPWGMSLPNVFTIL